MIRSSFLTGLALLLLTAGCAVGPEYVRPFTPADDGAFVHGPDPAAAAEPEPLEADTVEPWWHSFDDPATSELVQTALDANTDLRQAAARVLQAKAGLRQTRSSLFPQVGAGMNANRQRSSFVLPGAGRVTPESTTYSLDLTVAYQVDLFGGLSRGRQAAWADLLGQEAAHQTVVHTVVSEVVRARVRLSSFDRAGDIARAIRDSWADTQQKTERRYNRGLVSTLELRLARENLAAAEARVLAVELGLEQTRLALDVLLGRRPGTGEVLAAGLAPLPPLAPVPLGLPVELLERRPDVRAAEMRLVATTARVGVALADLFPGLTLNGSAGTRADKISSILSSESFVFNVVANLVGTIFDGGRRRAGVEVARASAEEAAASYAGTVLTALYEVEDALLRESMLQDQLLFLDQRVEEARAADKIARNRYERGVVELLDVLETERRLRAAEEALLGAQSDLWNARIDLHLALGGDWGVVPDARLATASAPKNKEDA
jgi:NodT family efflux transporter outer membrane factor (OMF) lipoprotein